MPRLLLALLVALSGCGRDDFPKFTTLENLRVLGIRANTPETSPGATVQLTALISDVTGAGRALRVVVEACSDPGVGYGANPTCSGVADRVAVADTTVNLTGPAYTAALTAQSVTIPTTVLANYSGVDQYNGVPYLVTYSVSAGGGAERVDAFKRILVSTKPLKNSNPLLTDVVNAASTTVSALPTQATTLYPAITSGSNEIFSVLNGNGTTSNFQETLTTTWFASDGSFDVQRTESSNGNGYQPPGSRPTSHSVVIVLVTRDGRGGETWVIKSY